jgi:hypothetical protein
VLIRFLWCLNSQLARRERGERGLDVVGPKRVTLHPLVCMTHLPPVPRVPRISSSGVRSRAWLQSRRRAHTLQYAHRSQPMCVGWMKIESTPRPSLAATVCFWRLCSTAATPVATKWLSSPLYHWLVQSCACLLRQRHYETGTRQDPHADGTRTRRGGW